MFYRLVLVSFLIVFFSCSSHQYKNPHVRIETAKGDIEVELFPAQAPKSVAAFLRNVDSGYYKNTSFYRILSSSNQAAGSDKSRLIQGGLWKTKYKLSASLPGVPHETTQQTKITHTDGTVSFARGAPGTASTEFFICIGDQHGFDYGGSNNPDGQGYAAFGRVVSGMKVVMDIYNSPEDEQDFDPPIDIYNIVRL
ncbi:MAG TPA: peptidylprolyl isomerase [Chitinophagaceae bacterium]|nr:peptidylprolyl isomerase [Chitinophagaceae bacterium]